MPKQFPRLYDAGTRAEVCLNKDFTQGLTLEECVEKRDHLNQAINLLQPDKNKSDLIAGVPEVVDPDRLYVVIEKPQAGYSMGIVVRGEDCNWRSKGIIAHCPLKTFVDKPVSSRFFRIGELNLEDLNYVWHAAP